MMNKLMVRTLMGHTIHQRVFDENLCISDLFIAYEFLRKQNGWLEKKLKNYFILESEQEFIIELVEKLGYLEQNGRRKHFFELIEKKGFIPALRYIRVYSTIGKGKNRKTLVDPYIFVAIAIWLNPAFKAEVVIWITDNLILNRIEAGHRYNQLSKAIDKHILSRMDPNSNSYKFCYTNFAKLINKKIFGKHEKNLRQLASREELMTLSRLQDRITAFIEIGYIKDYQDAKKYIDSLSPEDINVKPLKD